jgi:hypothetical protein
VNERRLRQAVRQFRAPGEDLAEERARRVVDAAYARTEAIPSAPRRARWVLALVAAGVLMALVLSPAGASVRSFVSDLVTQGRQNAAPALRSLPGGGTLLVQSGDGPWIVHADGSRRLLGQYDEATWSPRGLYVAVARGGVLSAVDPQGAVHWSVARHRIGDIAWSAPDGYRIAYRSGDSLRVIAGDGTGDHLLARKVATVAPAWQPGPAHVLAYVDRHGDVVITSADSGERVATVPVADRPLGLEWSSSGAQLLVRSAHAVRVLDSAGHPVRTLAATGRIAAAQYDGSGTRVAEIVERSTRAGTTRSQVAVLRLSAEPASPRVVFSSPGRLAGLAWSPTDRLLLVGWPAADEWLFVPASGAGKTAAFANISRQFAPSDAATRFPRIAGWCCHSELPG